MRSAHVLVAFACSAVASAARAPDRPALLRGVHEGAPGARYQPWRAPEQAEVGRRRGGAHEPGLGPWTRDIGV